MGESSGATIVSTENIPIIVPNIVVSSGGGAGGVGDGRTGGNSNTDGTINPYNPGDPDINIDNEDYLYPCDCVYKTYIRTQWEDGNNGSFFELPTCVAHAIATAIEILEYKKRGVQYNFSNAFIYGSRAGFRCITDMEKEGMNFDDAFNETTNVGVCFWRTASMGWLYRKSNEAIAFPDFDWVNCPSPNADQYSRNQKLYTTTANDCKHFKFGGWTRLGSADTAAMKHAIQTYGCGLLILQGCNDLRNAETNDGIVVCDPNHTDNTGHLLCVRGWKKIGGVDHWICQNSWKKFNGDYVGHNGFFFIPFNYAWTIDLVEIRPYYPTASVFNWSTLIYPGGTAALLADDWNSFAELILTILRNRNVQRVAPVHYVKPGDRLTAEIFNEAVQNLNAIVPTGISLKMKGEKVIANDFNVLVSKLNALL